MPWEDKRQASNQPDDPWGRSKGNGGPPDPWGKGKRRPANLWELLRRSLFCQTPSSVQVFGKPRHAANVGAIISSFIYKT